MSPGPTRPGSRCAWAPRDRERSRALPALRPQLELRRCPDPRPRHVALLGVLDITGGDQIVVPQTMALIRATVRLAESELARDRLTVRPRAASGRHPSPGLEALGRSDALVAVDDARGHTARFRLSPRHSEMLLLLASAPHGLSGDELAVLLYEDDGGSSTLRAEMNRLRHLLDDSFLGSRPYRLTAATAGDWLGVEARLAAGDVATARSACIRGPLLPRSVGARRRTPEGAAGPTSCGQLLGSGQADLMSSWTRSAWGADDYEAWTRSATCSRRGRRCWALAARASWPAWTTSSASDPCPLTSTATFSQRRSS
jgi:hypothetical protein